MLSLLADIVNIDSGSFDKPGVARVLRRQRMPQQAIVSADRAVGASEWIKDQRENMLSLLADIVNIDSGSFDKPGVARV
ncbi:hypothetical protein, partial [Escherichia coli]|uniref:hypothetical protein n=1 Tax=Escherichia coli TaxID=562 RepID=UPI001BC896CD